eukprot:6213450-Pleurochrysis_carterae.AAC.1
MNYNYRSRRSVGQGGTVRRSGGGRGSGVPLALFSEVGTQGKNRVRARSIPIFLVKSGLERRKGEG